MAKIVSKGGSGDKRSGTYPHELAEVKNKAQLAQILDGLDISHRSILTDPRIKDAVQSLPERFARNFGKALLSYPEEVAILLDFQDMVRSGNAQNPRDTLRSFISKGEDFSFCVNPYTGMTLIDDAETGHDDTLDRAGVPKVLHDRFTVGMSFADDNSLTVTKHTVHSFSPEESSSLAYDALRDLGMPDDIKLPAPKQVSKISLLTRGKTPGGKSIPLWNPSNEPSGVVFDQGYCYTSFFIKANSIHARAAATILRFTADKPFEVFNNVKGDQGSFFTADNPTLCDSRDNNVSGTDRRLIVRAKSRGDMPLVFHGLYSASISRTLMEDRGGSD